MKQTPTYYKIKWISFFITLTILGIALIALLFSSRSDFEAAPPKSQSDPLSAIEGGFYSNEAFGLLIEKNLKELGFLEKISFKGEDEGSFSIRGEIKDSERLLAIFPDLLVYKVLLDALEEEQIQLICHLGEGEDGYARLIADTLIFSDYRVPAGKTTPYIEEFTSINDLFEAPIHEIALDEQGITFQGRLPPFIQTA